MADSGNPEDLVSKVVIEGTEAEAAKLKKFSDEGSAAFDKLAASAKKAGVSIQGSAENIDKFKSQLGQASGDIKQAASDVSKVSISSSLAPDLGLIERGAKSLVTSIRAGIPAIASFVTRLTGVGAAAAAAGIGILKLASNVAKASSTQSNALDTQLASQVQANNSQLAGVQGAIQYEAAQRKLQQQLATGQISFSDYSKALATLRTDYQEQIRVSAQLEAAQESVRLENERLTKQAADTKAFDALIQTWGGPMLTALRALGGEADQVFTQFKNAFGPAVASGLDLITGGLSKNSGAIGKFFDDASKKLSDFISRNGPAIEKAFATIGTAVSTVFDGILAALPGLLTFFNDSLVPAVKGFGEVLDVVASTVNTIFGTKLTGGAIVFLVILGQMTGAFLAVINVIRIFIALGAIIAGLPFGAVFLVIAAAIGILLFLFPQLRAVAADVFNAVLTVIKGMASGASDAVQGVITFFRNLIAFFAGLPGAIGGFFVQLWADIVAGVDSAVTTVITGWNNFLEFMAALPGKIATFFADMGAQAVVIVSGWVSQVIEFFAGLLTKAKSFLQPIIDLLNTIASLSSSAGGTAATAGVTAATGGHIKGPGTATSDSIPAWLSDGEFIVKTKSVMKYGAGLLHAINNGTFQMPKFNLGGLVSGMIHTGPRLAYADGGPVSAGKGMQPLNLNLFGQEFNGLMAPEDVGSRLTKFAVERQNKSAGRKPAWVGRGRNN